ncbi:hypothetical protein ES703_97207 [subsurface metagenome]
MAKQTIELAPGGSRVVSFEAVPSKAKTYSVSVNGLTGSFIATLPPVTFTLSIKNTPPGAYGWSCVPPAAYHNWPGEYIVNTWTIISPPTATISVAIWDGAGAIISQKEITGTFEDGGLYILDYGKSTFEKLANVPEFVGLTVPSSVPSGGSFTMESKWYLVSPLMGFTPYYGVRMRIYTPGTGFWDLQSETAVNPATGVHMLRSTAKAVYLKDYTTYEQLPLPPGRYPIHALLMASNIIRPVITRHYTFGEFVEIEYGAPQPEWDFGVVGELVVTEPLPPVYNYVPMPSPTHSAGVWYAQWLDSAQEFARPLDTSGFKDWLARYIASVQAKVSSYESQLAPYIKDGLVREDKYSIAVDYVYYKAALEGALMAWQYFESVNWYR